MRTVRVERTESQDHWLWLAAGAVLGVTAGVLIADRLRGRRGSLRALAGQGRRLAREAISNIGPLMETVRSVKDAWDARDFYEDEPWSAENELGEKDRGGARSSDEDEEDLDDDAADGDERDHDALDERVLEAFSHDPILAYRLVEIDEPREGVILLRGRVRSDREAKHAVTIARGVPGVQRVRQRLTVRERPR